MKRRSFILAALATGLIGCTPSAGLAEQPFNPTRFSVEVRGSGPDVILIPGLTSGRDVWNSTVASLPGYRYHLVQVGGFAGEAVRGNAQGDVVAPLAQEIGRYIDAKGLKRPAIVGHSMGGTVAMMIGARQPNRAGKIVVVDMLPQPAGLFGASSADLGPLANSLRGIVATPGGRRLFESFLGNRASRNNSDSDVVARAMSELASIDLSDELSRIKVPLTVLYASPGGEAARTDRVYANAYASNKAARLVRIDESGHMIMFDQPARFRSALKEALGR